jgi:hypothetical protein
MNEGQLLVEMGTSPRDTHVYVIIDGVKREIKGLKVVEAISQVDGLTEVHLEARQANVYTSMNFKVDKDNLVFFKEILE